MKKWLWLFLFAFPLAAQVSQPNPQSRVAGRFVAFNYGQWNVGLYQPPAGTGSQTFSVSTATVQLPDGRQVMPFATNAPLYVGTEKVTVSAVGSGCVLNTVQPGACVLTATFANPHTNAERVSSATFGLQEALDDAGASGGGAATIDSAWENSGGTTAIKNAATLPSNTAIEDVRTGTGGGGVTQLIAGTNITLDPSGGTGAVTINATGGSGPVQTCDASTLAAYGYGVCVKTLNAAQLLSWDGTIGTAISIIDAPGSGLMIQPSSIAVQYEAGSHPFSASAGLSGAYGSNELGLNDFAVDFTQSANRLSNQIGGFGLLNADPTGVTAVPFGLFAANVINQGAIASSTVDAGGHGYTNGDTGTISGGNATYAVTSVSAGNGAIVAVNPTPDAAGTGYAVNDTGVLTHGSGTAAYVVDSVPTSGAILTLAVGGTAGTGYTVGDVVNIAGTNGDAFGVISSIGALGVVTGVVIPATGGPSVDLPPNGSGGTGYGITSNVSAGYYGSAGYPSSIAVGSVSGSGYAIGDLGKLSGAGNGNQQYVVTAVGAGGSVAAINLYRGDGVAYTPASDVATTIISGSGDGTLLLNVVTVATQAGDGNLTVDITGLSVGVATFHLTSNGTGYSIESNSPTATGGGQPGTGTGFEVNITNVNAGIVTGFSVTDATPDTYSVATGVGTAITSGSGDGTFTINIPTITQGNGDAVVTIDYQNVTVH